MGAIYELKILKKVSIHININSNILEDIFEISNVEGFLTRCVETIDSDEVHED
ncbi:MAG: hypothetical protein KGZ51_03155 [Erysipelothrix sp.]|jgi:hypothetical protein|nr:hypothetical protein [Erysipelothrix sp.]